MTTLIDLVAAVLRGDETEWRPNAARDAPGPSNSEHDFLQTAVQHEVAALVGWRLQQAGTLDRWPGAIRDPLKHLARRAALDEVSRLGFLQEAVQALHDAGVPCLLLKGAALAYRVYPEPWLRPRSDNDLMVAAGDAERAGEVLIALGYQQIQTLDVSTQSPYVKSDAHGIRQIIDLHRQISNRPLFADMVAFDELAARAVGVPALSEHARTLDDMHALLLACVHPAAHHGNAEHLLWSYDSHLLATRLDGDAFDALVDLARNRRVTAICATNLRRTAARFHTALPPGTLERLVTTGEMTAIYLDSKAWRGDVRLSDFRLLPTRRAKLRMIRDVVLPGTDYIMKEYNLSHRLFLPAVYVYRLIRGTWRLLRRLARD